MVEIKQIIMILMYPDKINANDDDDIDEIDDDTPTDDYDFWVDWEEYANDDIDEDVGVDWVKYANDDIDEDVAANDDNTTINIDDDQGLSQNSETGCLKMAIE